MRTAKAIDGATLAWQAEGAGPTVVLCNGIANDAFQWARLLELLRGRARVVTWDYRGHGASEPARDLATLEVGHLAEDLRAVLDAAEVERAALIGYSMGSQVVFEAWRRLPERVAGLVSVLGCAGRTFDQAAGPAVGRVAHALVCRTPVALVGANLRLWSARPRVAHAAALRTGIFEPEIALSAFAGWWAHLGKLDPATFHAMMAGLQRHDAEDVLPTVRVPTLVVSGGRDLFVRPAVGRRLAAAIPGAELAEYPRATHAGLVGHAAEMPGRIVGFLERHALVIADTPPPARSA
ncbi:MAG: alpha/beta fold hydrolase [Myxococcota bacterium]